MNGLNRALAVGLSGAFLVAAAAPSEARWRGGAVAAGAVIGLAAGAIAGSAIASRPYYGSGYGYYGGGYAYEPAYAYQPAYTYSYPAATYYAPAPAYAYQPAPTYTYQPAPTYVAPTYGYAAVPAYAPAGGRCWVSTNSDKGFGYYRAC